MLKPIECRGCSLYKLGRGFSLPDGKGTSGVVAIAEALGNNEVMEGLPLRPRAEAGSKFEEALRLLGRSRNELLIWNVLGCQPPGNKLYSDDGYPLSYTENAISHCAKAHFERIVGGFKTPHIKTILALGATALQTLTGRSMDDRWSINMVRGYVMKSKYGPVVGTYHPSFLRRGNPNLTPAFVEDIAKAFDVASGAFGNFPGGAAYKEPQYQTSPSLDDAWSFFYQVQQQSSGLILSYDIETSSLGYYDEEDRTSGGEMERYAREAVSQGIEQIQFSYRKGYGIALPWSAGYLPVILALLKLPCDKANHNTWNFDNPIIRNAGARINGSIHDTMWMFKHYHPQLERGLQKVASLVGFPFPWKHLFSDNLAWYGCADVDAVQYILHDLPDMMRARGVWRGYYRHVYELHIELEKASKDRGIPVSEDKRQQLKATLEQKLEKLDSEIQAGIPWQVKDLSPRRGKVKDNNLSYGYKREPKDVKQAKERYASAVIEWNETGNAVFGLVTNDGQVEPFYLYVRRECGYVKVSCSGIDKKTGEEWIEKRWCKVKPFKASKQSLKRYIEYKASEQAKLVEQLEQAGVSRKHTEEAQQQRDKLKELKLVAKGYVVPRDVRTRKETTGKKELEKVIEDTGDMMLTSVLEYRSVKKMITNDLKNWKPHSDGCVHPEWNFGPPTTQLASRGPNVQNASKHTDTGQAFRGIIEIPHGKFANTGSSNDAGSNK